MLIDYVTYEVPASTHDVKAYALPVNVLTSKKSDTMSDRLRSRHTAPEFWFINIHFKVGSRRAEEN